VVNVDFKVIPQCQINNKYINGYFPIVIATFKCNRDICCLICGNGHDITYYIVKYITNNESEFENQVAFHLSAFHKRVGRKFNLLDDVVVNIKDVRGY